MSNHDDRLDDETIEALLKGHPLEPSSEFSDLSEALVKMATSFQPTSDPAIDARNLGAIFSTADKLASPDTSLDTSPLKPHRRTAMLKSLTAGLAVKIGLGVAATALAAGGGIALVNNDSAPKPAEPVTESAIDLDAGAAQLVAAAGEAQDDYQAACEAHMEEFGTKMNEAMDRFAKEHPDLASSMPTMAEGSPGATCTMDWKTLVKDVCSAAVKDRPAPSDQVLSAMPEGLRPLVIDPCNAEWSKVDWQKAMADFDPSSMMKAACDELDADDAITKEGTAAGGTFEFEMNGLGFQRLCESNFDFSKVNDFLTEMNWEEILDGKMPSEEQINKWKESFGIGTSSAPGT